MPGLPDFLDFVGHDGAMVGYNVYLHVERWKLCQLTGSSGG